MLDSYVPQFKVGCLQPGTVIDNQPFEFYRLAPRSLMLVMVGIGLKEFSSADVERVFAPLESYLDQLVDRGVDLVIQNGVPLPILIGIEGHDRMVAHMAKYSGKPATTTVLSVVAALEEMGLRRIAIVNKWTDEMNRSLGAFFARGGATIVGGATKSLHPADFHRIAPDDHMQLALELGRRAFNDNPDCDAVYIGGGSWIVEPIAAQLETEFGKPVICNQSAVIRHILKMLGAWKPIPGHSRVLAAA
jgi:maleate cis-trans isomerase